MSPKIVSLLIGCILWTGALMAQLTPKSPTAATAFYQKGTEALLKKNYNQAIRQFTSALEISPGLYAAHRGIGAAYAMLNNYPKAAYHYEKTLYGDPNFSRTLYFETADAFYKSGEFEKALDYYYRFSYLQKKDSADFALNLDKEAEAELRYIEVLDESITACKMAMDSLQFINSTQVENMGPAINSEFNDYFPMLLNGETKLYFNRQKAIFEDEDLFVSEYHKGKWENAKPVGNFNTKFPEGMVSMVRDGRKIYFTACRRKDVQGPCDIWEALISGEKIVDIKSIDGAANSEYWEGQASISCDGSTIYFASNREGGQGLFDLWFSRRQMDGSWSTPQNLGNKINTDGYEEAPYISNDGNTLYFTSDGHPGMGQKDIYMSWRDDKTGNWTDPINLGPPVNSAFDDMGLFLSANNKSGYFASNRTGGFGDMDIYHFDLSKALHSDPITFVEGYVLDSLNGEPIPSILKINGRDPIATDLQGRFFICAGADEVLDLEVTQDAYYPYHNTFPVPEWENKELYPITLLLQPFLTPKSVVSTPPPPPVDTLSDKDIITPLTEEYTHTIYFNFDEYEISATEFSLLEEFSKFIKTKNIIRADIIGYSDDVGADKYNLLLSEKRAKNIAIFFRENDIVIEYIYMEGKGEINDDNPKRLNRRVDIKVIVENLKK
ncbi:MAG: OmpA family protein [Saprospiraceae bacterium]